MRDSEPQDGGRLGLRMYESSEGGVLGWVVSGVSHTQGKRWRRRFASKEKAKEFYAREVRRLNGIEKQEAHSNNLVPGRRQGEKVVDDDQKLILRDSGGLAGIWSRRKDHGGRSREKGGELTGWKICLVVVVAVLATWMDRQYQRGGREEHGETLIVEGFEENPVFSGWICGGPGAEWTDSDQVSGRRSIAVGEGGWVSPLLVSESLRWYRLSFRCKAPESMGSGGGVGYGRCRLLFFDQNGKKTNADVELAIHQSEKWVKNDLRFRAHPIVDEAGSLASATMRVEFQSLGARKYYVDELRLERTTLVEVGNWADQFYGKLPARLEYQGKASRWKRLNGTMEKLRGHQRVRIVLLGDRIQADLANAPIDVFLQRLYPGCVIEVIASIKEREGVQYFKDNMAEYVLKWRPDLLIIGGVSNRDDMKSFRNVVEQVRSSNALARRRTEILLLTNGWSPNAVEDGAFRFTSEMKELDQEQANNSTVPDDYRGHLLHFAAENGVEFLDMMGIASEFIFGPASKANVGPPTNADGVPFSYWMRDWLHPDESGKQIMGRIIEAYFAPSGAEVDGSDSSRQASVSGAVRLFDPSRNPVDEVVYAAAKREFEASAVERPALALSLGRESVFERRRAPGRGASFRITGQAMREIGYNFDDALDIRSGDVAVYWSFRSNLEQGSDASKLTMHLSSSDPTVGTREDRMQVSLTVRPGAESVLKASGGVQMGNEVEQLVEVPVENFLDATRVGKFRVLLRWLGGDRIVAEAASWNPRTKRWEGFVPFDRPGAPPLVMELSAARHFNGATSFKSIYFEAQSDVPFLEHVLVTMRPSMIR